MENTCKQCKSKFLIQKGLLNYCSIHCKTTYSSTINKTKNESIKFFSSLVKNSYSKIWLKNCKKCLTLYTSDSKDKKCCFKCSPRKIVAAHCYIYVSKCRRENCENLATRKNSYKKVYCKNCAIIPYSVKVLKKEVKNKVNKKEAVNNPEVKINNRPKKNQKSKKHDIPKKRKERDIPKIMKNPRIKSKESKLKKSIFIEKKCLSCKKTIHLPMFKKNQTCCNIYCFREYCRVSGRYSQMGKKSAQVQSKRSKNEILLAELLSKEYSIETNFKLIDNWDCDIYIKELNLAILWDGQWHRVQISKKQSLKQVQNRDRIKRELFIEKGVNIITINDYGKYNQEFVKIKCEEVIEILHNNFKEQFNIII